MYLLYGQPVVMPDMLFFNVKFNHLQVSSMLFSYLFLLILAVNFTWILSSSEIRPTRPMYNCSWDDGMEDLEIEFDILAQKLQLHFITIQSTQSTLCICTIFIVENKSREIRKVIYMIWLYFCSLSRYFFFKNSNVQKKIS